MTETEQIKALVAFGKVGASIIGARILSILALLGYLSLSGYVSYAPTWQGVAVCAILALIVVAAFRGERQYRDQPKEPQ